MKEETEHLLQNLIPGLPDEIALDCLARVPYRFHSVLKSVCRGWNDLLADSSFYHYRKISHRGEDLVCLVQAVVTKESAVESAPKDKAVTRHIPPVYGLSIYNATDDTWRRVMPLAPILPAGIPMFCQCVAVSGKLVLIGGWDPATLDSVADVFVCDFVRGGGWRRGAPMSVARSFFACAAVGSTIYVAGGHDNQKNALRSAEAYDVESDTWRDLPPMADERDECQGLACKGRFWVVSGYRTEAQGRFDSGAECYDPVSDTWTELHGVWPFPNSSPRGTCYASPRVPKGQVPKITFSPLWFINTSNNSHKGVMEFDERDKNWKLVGPTPEGICSSPCTTLISGGPSSDRIFVIGSGHGGGGPHRHRACVLETNTRKWTHINTPVDFSGFVYSSAALYL
ncbi:F-box/kelch-repeat protein SKIP20-like [Magnolia sinica]|uniref:F-box/kelch-repeat protein SKIP20-like n=1 Tax=Magnolia sinica TaxID=86752 RepID=UPI00265A9950|nr:F-box/kelch-repeat protein SKIP20-like [Magnolia sinica]